MAANQSLRLTMESLPGRSFGEISSECPPLQGKIGLQQQLLMAKAKTIGKLFRPNSRQEIPNGKIMGV